MDYIRIEVNGITKKEYFQASELNNLRAYGILAVAMVVICGIIMLAGKNFSLSAIIGPAAVYVIFVVALELITRLNYKGQLENVDPVIYEFDETGWQISVGDEAFDLDWKATPRFKKTKDCIFVYSDETSSNLLPRRLMTPEQEAQLEKWFKSSRAEAKIYEREKFRMERAEFKANHPGLRFGRTGPAWGPWKRK